jgi:hypothetical protein
MLFCPYIKIIILILKRALHKSDEAHFDYLSFDNRQFLKRNII